MPDIARLRLDPSAKITKKKPSKEQKALREKLDSVMKNFDVKAFESPSSMTEDSDDKALADRGFKLSYKDMGVGVDLKTTADEATTMTDDTEHSATESATEQSEPSEKTAADSATMAQKEEEEVVIETVSAEETAATTASENEAQTTEAESTTANEASNSGPESEKEEPKLELS